MFADLLDPETGVIALKHRFPRCLLCDNEKPYDHRYYITVFGHCEDCEIRMTPAIIRKKNAGRTPRFPETSCSQCGKGFGPGDSGYSHCHQHRRK